MKILIADDHALFRDGLNHVLNQLEDDINVLEACDFASTLAMVEQHPDIELVLLDLHMPGSNGFSTLKTLGKRYPALPVVIISASNDYDDINQALNHGAVGFIPKDTKKELMLSGLRLILSGGLYIPQSYIENKKISKVQLLKDALTARQREVLAMIIEGKSNKVIAVELDLAESTVKMHVTDIFKKLGVTNRTQAALIGMH